MRDGTYPAFYLAHVFGMTKNEVFKELDQLIEQGEQAAQMELRMNGETSAYFLLLASIEAAHKEYQYYLSLDKN